MFSTKPPKVKLFAGGSTATKVFAQTFELRGFKDHQFVGSARPWLTNGTLRWHGLDGVGFGMWVSSLQ